MIKSIILGFAVTNWMIGMILFCFTDEPYLISKTNYQRPDKLKHKPYSIKEIRTSINFTNDQELKQNLKRKILIRKIAFRLMISTPILIFIGNVFFN